MRRQRKVDGRFAEHALDGEDFPPLRISRRGKTLLDLLPRNAWLVMQMQFDRLKRREFITLRGGAAARPSTLAAQEMRVRRIGVLMELAADEPQARSNLAALQRRLYDLEWSQGSNLAIDYRWASDDRYSCGSSPKNWWNCGLR
jgi:hypothetical protein